MKKLLLCLPLFALLPLAGNAATTKTIDIGSAETMHKIEVFTDKGVKIPIEAEDLTTTVARPIRKTKARLDKKHYPGFFSVNKIRIKPGTKIKTRSAMATNPNIEPGPYRLSVFQIFKRPGQDRKLRLVRSEYLEELKPIGFEMLIEAMEENSFIVTLEKVTSEKQLSKPLRKIKEQKDGEMLVRGWGTNMTFSKMKLKLTGIGYGGKKEKSDRDFEEIVADLIEPQAVIMIRVKNRDLLEDVNY